MRLPTLKNPLGFHLLTLFLGISIFSRAQTNVLVLKKQLEVATSDTAQYQLYHALGTAYREVNIDSSLYFLGQALHIAQVRKDAARTAQSMYRLGHVYMYKLSDETQALEWLKKCVISAKQAKDNVLLARCYGIIGVIADHQNLPQEEWLLKALEYAKKTKDWQTIAAAYNVLTVVYTKKNKFAEAEQVAFEMMKLCEKNSKARWIWACLDYCKLLITRGKSQEAQSYLQKASMVGKSLMAKGGNSETIYPLIQLELQLAHYENAEKLVQQGMDIERAKPQPDSGTLLLMYKAQHQAYAGQRKFQQAYESQQVYINLALNNRNKEHKESSELQMTRLQAALDREKQTTEIMMLAEQKKQQQAFLLSTIVIVVLLVGFVFLLQRNKSRIELQKAELTMLNTTKDKLFAILSHDLRSPVAGLKNYLMLTDWGVLTQAEFANSTKNLTVQLNNVHTMLDNVLNWSFSQMRGIRPKRENVEVASIIEEEIELLLPMAQIKTIHIVNEISANVQIMVDRNHVAVIFRNLLQNALKFTHSGGKIRLSYSKEKDMHQFVIADTGVGMSEEQLQNLFQLNKTTSQMGTAREQGTGVGLVLVKELVEANQGTLSVTSELTKGTMFTLGFIS
ncbi:tetratricopeptide repeat-containing sensor histidine kinase [Runella rosea]|nr:HAMP domain-containing sensor histidine kinase [Runella rosea]